MDVEQFSFLDLIVSIVLDVKLVYTVHYVGSVVSVLLRTNLCYIKGNILEMPRIEPRAFGCKT